MTNPTRKAFKSTKNNKNRTERPNDSTKPFAQKGPRHPYNKRQGTMFQKLNEIKEQIQVTYQPKRYVRLKPTTQIGVDGEDHINTHQIGKTDLGRALATTARLPFKHTKYGRFESIEGFWHYIKSDVRDDRMRHVSGDKARIVGRRIKSGKCKNFRALIIDAIYQKVMTYPTLVDSMKESTLPFDHYYLHNRDEDVRIRPPFTAWLMAGLEEIRRAIKEGVEPDVSIFMDEGEEGPLWPDPVVIDRPVKEYGVENMVIKNTGETKPEVMVVDNMPEEHEEEIIDPKKDFAAFRKAVDREIREEEKQAAVAENTSTCCGEPCTECSCASDEAEEDEPTPDHDGDPNGMSYYDESEEVEVVVEEETPSEAPGEPVAPWVEEVSNSEEKSLTEPVQAPEAPSEVSTEPPVAGLT